MRTSVSTLGSPILVIISSAELVFSVNISFSFDSSFLVSSVSTRAQLLLRTPRSFSISPRDLPERPVFLVTPLLATLVVLALDMAEGFLVSFLFSFCCIPVLAT